MNYQFFCMQHIILILELNDSVIALGDQKHQKLHKK